MLFRFLADEIREQIGHAQGARLRPAGQATQGPLEPSLILTRRGGRVFLISNGIPESKRPAYAVGFGASESGEPEPVTVDTEATAREACATLDADDDIGPRDFTEGIKVGSFERALAEPQVRIVVRRTYINVLGGQPLRLLPYEVSSGPSYRRGLRLAAGSGLTESRRPPKRAR